MSYLSSIAEFIASNKRRRDDEVLQLSDVPGDSPVDLSNEDDGDGADKERRSNPEPLSKKKKRIALRAIPTAQGSGLFVLLQGLLY